jgi:hypothetical protein
MRDLEFSEALGKAGLSLYSAAATQAEIAVAPMPVCTVCRTRPHSPQLGKDGRRGREKAILSVSFSTGEMS